MSKQFRKIISNVYTDRNPYPQGENREQAIDDIIEALNDSQWTSVDEGLPEEDYDKYWRVWVTDKPNGPPLEQHARYYEGSWWVLFIPVPLIGRVTHYRSIIGPSK